ncbi:hypothetical protein KUCAC02_010592, partial [Chaenocephalus aceratus]
SSWIRLYEESSVKLTQPLSHPPSTSSHTTGTGLISSALRFYIIKALDLSVSIIAPPSPIQQRPPIGERAILCAYVEMEPQ